MLEPCYEFINISLFQYFLSNIAWGNLNSDIIHSLETQYGFETKMGNYTSCVCEVLVKIRFTGKPAAQSILELC